MPSEPGLATGQFSDWSPVLPRGLVYGTSLESG